MSTFTTKPDTVAMRAMHWFTYGGIIFNLGATTSAVFCLIILSDFNARARTKAAREPDSLPSRVQKGEAISREYLGLHREGTLLISFGLDKSWGLSKYHMLVCFVLGTICAFVSEALWIWQLESIPVSIVLMVVLVLVVIFPVGVFCRLVFS